MSALLPYLLLALAAGVAVTGIVRHETRAARARTPKDTR